MALSGLLTEPASQRQEVARYWFVD